VGVLARAVQMIFQTDPLPRQLANLLTRVSGANLRYFAERKSTNQPSRIDSLQIITLRERTIGIEKKLEP
jgi:hypothetical protein